MPRIAIDDEKKQHIVTFYLTDKYTQAEIAEIVGVNRRSILRVLTEKGVLRPTVKITGGEERLLTTVRGLRMSPDMAIAALTSQMKPSSSVEIAQQYLRTLSKTELTALYMNTLFANGETVSEKDATHAVG